MKIINNQNIVLINEVNSLIKYESKVYLSCNHFTAFALFELVESLKKATQVQIMLSIDLNSEDDFRLIHAPSEKQLELALDRKSKINEIIIATPTTLKPRPILSSGEKSFARSFFWIWRI